MNEAVPTTLGEMLQRPGPARRNGSVALVLGTGGAIASLMLLPYALAMTKDASPSAIQLLATFAANFVLVTLLAWAGLRSGAGLGLDSPKIRNWFTGRVDQRPSRWMLAIFVGVASAVAAGLLQLVLPLPVDSVDMTRIPAWWEGLLASFYGGIVEETIFRLFLVSLLVWLAARVREPRHAVYWTAIVIAAVLFGVAHLPNWSAISHEPISAAIIASVVAANSICGIAFGWLFWRHGLEHAIVAHFSTDIVLHVLLPLMRPT